MPWVNSARASTRARPLPHALFEISRSSPRLIALLAVIVACAVVTGSAAVFGAAAGFLAAVVPRLLYFKLRASRLLEPVDREVLTKESRKPGSIPSRPERTLRA